MQSAESERSAVARLSEQTERRLEAVLYASRWLMAPFYLGLVLGLVALLFVFAQELIAELSHLPTMTGDQAILMALTLIDLSLAGNLMLIVIYSGYENFVSKFDLESGEDRPAWMGKIDFSGLKLKLVSSIVAISAIALLRTFMNIGHVPLDEPQIQWKVIVHLTFVTSGVLLAFTDFLSSRAQHPGVHEKGDRNGG